MRRYTNHLYRRISASRVVITSAILLSGCFTSYDDTELDASEQEAVFDPGGPLPEFVISGEMDLATGRLAKIPVSWFPEYTVDVVGAHDVMFRATCGSTATCDTGLLVSEPTLGSLYNDDDPGGPTAHGAGPGGSFVDPPARSVGARYTVRPFSMRRATSRTTVQWSANGGATWTSLSPSTPLGSAINVGGTLIRVGALTRGDYLEVMSRSNGAQGDDTRMILFSAIGETGHPLTTAEDQTTTERDPRINIATDTWSGANNFVLIGKQAPPILYSGNLNIETRVDLVHGPLSQVTYMPPPRDRLDCACATVPPGRYLTYLRATIDLPVGAYNSASNQHLSGSMPVLGADGCPNSQRDGDVNASWFRGVGNDIVMRMELQFWNGTAWVAAVRRAVPRGAFGGLPGDWTRFSLPLEVASLGTSYRLVATYVAPGVVVAGGWNYERNPEATELGVATANTLYRRLPFDDNKYKNTADLLGTRGSIISSEARVEERADQAPFQWDADIIGMQEVAKTSNWDNRLTDVMLDELRLRSSVLWTYAQGRGETWVGESFSDGPGMNPIFVNSQATTGAMPSSVYFSAAAKAAAGCSDNGGISNYAECHLSEQGLGDGDIYNYATAARAGSWRGNGSDRPIAVFNVHLEASEGPKDFAPRLGEVRSLMNKVDALLAAEPSAFNRAVGDTTRTSPHHAQNRFIVVGDWNIRAHECGEHYWILRMLRERYGYAVDVSMARTDAAGSLKQSMHTGDAPYVGEVPGGYQHMWTTDPRQPPAWTSWQSTHTHAYDSAFPWWATDWRSKTSTPDKAGERLSMIVLVGRGWADDDPVLDYSVMSDSNYPSPMNPHSRGVEMWRPHIDEPLSGAVYQLCTDAGSVANDARGYAPNYSLGCDSDPAGGTNPGAPALHTDHRPMGARVRVWSR